MTSIKLMLNGAQAWAATNGPLTSGMVGVPVTIEYDEAWDGLTKNLMCRCSPWGSTNGEIRTILDVGDASTVAHEVMQADMYLYLGVEGFSDDGTLVIPTTWARCGKIEYGANTCEDPSTNPELSVWNQIQTEMEQIRQDVVTPELVAEIKGYAQSATQAASNAERSKDNAVAASNAALSNAAAARNSADTAQTSAENASASASSAANLANGALQAQRAAEAAAERAEAAADSGMDVKWMYVTVEVEEEIACTGITLDKSALTFDGIGQQTIVATVTPADTTDTLVWTSSKPAVATVANGVVTAYANGSATITAACGEYSATCAVEVSGISEDDTVAVTSVTLDKTTASVQVGSTVTLTATVEPVDATNKTVTWTSDNETVAKVEGGVVTGLSEGTASLVAMTADGGFSAVCNVTVAVASNYKNLFDKDTMVTANEGITGGGVIGSSYNWGLARVPVEENAIYSIKMCETSATNETQYYNSANAGAFGFADDTGNTLISRLSFTQKQDEVGTNGTNALLQDYMYGTALNGNNGVEWVTFTTPAGCAYLLFNTTLKSNADKIQLEEGDTIHNYYLHYDGGAE